MTGTQSMADWELAARERVRDTYAAYTHAGDRFRLAELAACFTEDGVLEVKGDGTAVGREAIVAMLSGARRDPGSAAEVPRIRHFVANIAFTSVTSERIGASAYFQVLTQRGPDHWGRYRDVFVPVGARWLLSHRLVAVDTVMPGSWYERVHAS
ncbi:nuclear transport factor 2 family protein [Williamsia sp. R60]